MYKIRSLLKKLWQGKLSHSEARHLDGLLEKQDDDFRKDLNFSFEELLMSQESAVDDGMAAEILNRLLIKIEGLEKRKTKIISFIRRSFGWAAACAILGLAWFYLFRASEKPGSSDIKIVRAKTNPVLQKEITNNTAFSMEILLPDRSVVQLLA